MKQKASLLCLMVILLVSCKGEKASAQQGKNIASGTSVAGGAYDADMAALHVALAASKLPDTLVASILAKLAKDPAPFFQMLQKINTQRNMDSMLHVRADKEIFLNAHYAPNDLVALDGKGISVSRKGHMLRRAAFEALKEMNAAASKENITLMVSSAYRSYAYQQDLFARNVKEMGEKEAARLSARPGASQHQLGTAIDFGSITNAFAATKSGVWLARNARRFGFSLSYPEGLESVTGYAWESWHYRFIGKDAAALQDAYFDGIQFYTLKFLQAWPK